MQKKLLLILLISLIAFIGIANATLGASCTSGVDCGTGEYCGASATCMAEGGLGSTSCQPGFHLENGACVVDTATPIPCSNAICNGVCCAVGQTCENNQCTTPSTCSNVTCNGVCCATGQTCENNTCTTPSLCSSTNLSACNSTNCSSYGYWCSRTNACVQNSNACDCGNGICDTTKGETNASCSSDCSATTTNSCSSSNVNFCYSQSDCQNAGANWCQQTGSSIYICQASACSGTSTPSCTSNKWCGTKCCPTSEYTCSSSGQCMAPGSTQPTTTPVNTNNCISREEIERKITECKNNNGMPQTYWENGCEIVKCGNIQGTPVQQPINQNCISQTDLQNKEMYCRQQGNQVIYNKDPSGCTYIECRPMNQMQPQNCPSKEEMQRKEMDCRNAGNQVVWNNGPNGCSYVDCIEKMQTQWNQQQVKQYTKSDMPCPSQAEKDNVLKDCANRGGIGKLMTDPSGCEFANCYGSAMQQPMIQGQQSCGTPEENQNKMNDMALKCKSQGMAMRVKNDQFGCGVPFCEPMQNFNQQGFAQQICPAKEEIDNQIKKCETIEQKGIVVNSMNGCPQVKCVDPNYQGMQASQQNCGKAFKTSEEAIAFEDQCMKAGKRLVKEWDEKGCPVPKCINETDAIRGQCSQPPEEAKSDCENSGGQWIINKDDRGCVVMAKCIARANEADMSFSSNEITRVPSATKLIQLTLQLENIKVEFDKLARQTDELAKYYASVKDETNQKRFETVSGMFQSAKGKVDDIKNKISEKIDSIDDFAEIYRDLKYIQEIVMKEILYVMLSKDATIKETVASETVRDCKGDDTCFQESFRICSKALLSMEQGSNAISAEIGGINTDKTCGLTIKMKSEIGDYSMKCNYPDYAFSKIEPATFPLYCKGELLEHLTELTTATSLPSKVEASQEVVLPENQTEQINSIETTSTVNQVEQVNQIQQEPIQEQVPQEQIIN